MVLALAAGMAMTVSAFAQPAGDLSAFVGRWKINMTETKMEREGPTGNNTVRDPTFTWVFSPQSYGLLMDVYTKYPQPAPTRSMTVITDTKPHPCHPDKPCLTTGGNPLEQTYAYWQMDKYMLARLFYEQGKVVEYSHYAVSADGKKLSIVSWSPATPQWRNTQVFDKQ
jgi:hypothetical protein